MNDNQFKIFKPTKKFVLSANMVVYTLFVTLFGVLIVFNKYQVNSIFENIAIITGVLTCLTAVVLLITSQFTRKTLKGELKGIFELKDDSIVIDKNKIMLDKIEKIDFNCGDYLDKMEYHYAADFNPKRTNGVYNYCEIKTSEGENISLQFQQLNKNDIFKNRAYLIQYHKKGKIDFMKIIHILNIEGYEKIQEFKTELSKQE